jgi:hypothetical protein
MLRSRSRLSDIAVIVAAGLAVAACGSGSSNSTAATSGTNSSPLATTTYASAQATILGKSTEVVVNPAASAALQHADITVTAVAPATARTTLLFFPVSGGQIVVATLAGTVNHSGGLTFSHSGKSVTLANLVINTNMKNLTATVGGQSTPIFNLNLASRKRASGPHGTMVASNIKLTVTSQAATALNSGLGVSTFRAGMKFGIATLTVAYARGHR